MTRVVGIVLNWNNVRDTRACLASLAGTTMPLHVLVVDNGSTEAPAERLVEGFPSSDARVTFELVKNKENLGFARGMNVGFDRGLADGATHLWVLNNDVIVEPGTLRGLVDALDRFPSAAGVAPLVYDARRPGLISHAGGGVSLARGRTWHHHEGLARAPVSAPYVVDYAEGSALLLRADDVRAQGGFDPDYVAYWEDVDWAFRARERGRSMMVAPSARVVHGVSVSGGGSFGEYALYHRARNRFVCARKHAGLAQRVALPFVALADLPLELYHARRGTGAWGAPKAWLRGTWHGLIGRR